MKKVKISDPDAKVVTIRTVNDPVEAELIKNTLIDHGIDCHLDGEHQAGFTGTLGIGILVLESDAKFADETIRIHHPNES